MHKIARLVSVFVLAIETLASLALGLVWYVGRTYVHSTTQDDVEPVPGYEVAIIVVATVFCVTTLVSAQGLLVSSRWLKGHVLARRLTVFGTAALHLAVGVLVFVDGIVSGYAAIAVLYCVIVLIIGYLIATALLRANNEQSRELQRPDLHTGDDDNASSASET